ncbi:prepilin-type N-terminal cleavage/methylation domain-containing protein [Niveibacterium umoris]|uniref:Prepilin-type N-terminal cleavage/methylation domain-containing protein n=1 Tax=Niveibacterium umoris TaxID=1193620 RepID=A0A840BIE6_9RHOO|nr:type II secretion system protein [Niveibacterium umoris]MBB4012760.1 prepilin-type N-terminal cleavage/methylation domain-containing protein [Niveibacterium umoris]
MNHRIEVPKNLGFTLIEMAVAIAIIAVLSTSVLMAVRVQAVQRQTSETRAALDEAREALLAFASANGYLPCPASGAAAGYGKEGSRSNDGVCVNRRGLLPWETLGIQSLDGWNHRLAYLVSPALTVPPATPSPPSVHFTLDTAGTVRIAPSAASGGSDSTLLASAGSVACAVWSYGSNGYFANNPDGSAINGASAGPDETQNGSGSDLVVVARDISENPAAAGGAFDDQVIWISRFVLFGRMMAAGKLP